MEESKVLVTRKSSERIVRLNSKIIVNKIIYFPPPCVTLIRGRTRFFVGSVIGNFLVLKNTWFACQ